MQLNKATPQLATTEPADTLQRAAGSIAGQNNAPRSVLRGAKCHELTEVSIDWLRMSGPRCMYYEALHLLEKRFGKTEPGSGRFFLNSGHHWAEGGIFQDIGNESNAKHCVCELPGRLISELDHADVRQVVYDLHSMGFKTTRIDIAIDFYDRPRLIETVSDSCDRGELCRAKTYQRITQRSNGEMTGNGINIGQRGKKGSGRYLRIYDKGLETKTLEPGNWIRWEVELADDCAQQFSMAYTTNDESIECCLSHALWVVEFREATGKRLSRRPLATWFQELTTNINQKRVVASRTKSTVDSFVRWFSTAVTPKLTTIANITESNVETVVTHISGRHTPKQEHLQCPKVRSVAKSMGAKEITIK